MINYLKGILAEVNTPNIILDVSGVGYELECSLITCAKMNKQGMPVRIYTHINFRKDGYHLYGFSDIDERNIFRFLIKSPGVGPKLALTILSNLSVFDFHQCIREHSYASLIKIPGVGKKTAERLIIDMQDKLDDILQMSENYSQTSLANIQHQHIKEAIDALEVLGYRRHEARNAVQKIKGGVDNSQIMIRLALQQLAK